MDVFALLERVSRARQEVGQPLLFIWSLGTGVALPSPAVRDALFGALPALMICAEELFVAVETTEAVRSSFRALLLDPKGMGHQQRPPRLFRTRDEALAQARRIARDDVLGLERALSGEKP
ncbi:MAG TPA: hypothetical protein VF989_06995 [Polyangiaceae bacterium]